MVVENKYINFDNFHYNKVDSDDGCQYICQTCDRKLKRGKIHCQAVCNNLDEIKKEIVLSWTFVWTSEPGCGQGKIKLP